MFLKVVKVPILGSTMGNDFDEIKNNLVPMLPMLERVIPYYTLIALLELSNTLLQPTRDYLATSN